MEYGRNPSRALPKALIAKSFVGHFANGNLKSDELLRLVKQYTPHVNEGLSPFRGPFHSFVIHIPSSSNGSVQRIR